MTSFDNLERVEVQKKLMTDLHRRGKPFTSRKEKIVYCEGFYRSLGVEHGRNIGRIPIHISSAVRHFFHNNLQIGDVPKWAREDPTLITRFIEVLRVYGPSKAIVKARRGTLENPRKVQIIPPEDRESFVHLLDGVEVSSDEEEGGAMRKPRKQKSSSPQEGGQQEKEVQMKQILAVLAGNGFTPEASSGSNATPNVQTMLQALLLASAQQNLTSPPVVSKNEAVHSPALSAALSMPPTIAASFAEGKENTQQRVSLKHSCTMENILEKIKKTKRPPLQEAERS